jgi:N6-L-threonylcarbamoyladenine synthase
MHQEYILGIETSCDETSAAVLQENNVISNIVSSQEIHALYGGVVPELASREHIRLISTIIQKALDTAQISRTQLSGIAVTCGPGLVGALLVGLNFAKGMAEALQIPFIGVNHLEGHIYGNFLTHPEIEFPHLCLIVSGGHTLLSVMHNHLEYQVIGKTLDDAVGEAFDKAAKMLSLGYPGGPVVDDLAQKGDASFHDFPQAFKKENHFNFSYSGLKTALLVYLNDKDETFIKKNMNHICASYQRAAIEILVSKVNKAATRYNVSSIGVVGGVAANSLLRQSIKSSEKTVYLPHLDYCTDNAAMIARAGIERLRRGNKSSSTLNAYPALGLKEPTG